MTPANPPRRPAASVRSPLIVWLLRPWAFSLILAFCAFAANTAMRLFDLPAGDAAMTLRRFSEQSGQQIIFPVEQVRGVRTNAVKGQLTARDALDQMLAGTDLVTVEDARTGALTVRKRAAVPNPSTTAPQTASDRPNGDAAVEDAPVGNRAVGSGTITGRVFNPANGEYVRNAEVRIDGTDRAVTSGDGGHFQLTNVPAGEATVSVSHSGYARVTASVQVAPGQTITRDIELTSVSPIRGEEAVKLSAFIVSSEREGNAKAIMHQRNSMNLGTSIASDVFGDITEGNVGEFLKHLPGVELEYQEGTARSPRLGGLDPEYTGVAIDGMKFASIDTSTFSGAMINGTSGSAARSFSFEQVSIDNIESIEISRVTSADQDADAPAGTINLKTKRAFDRKGRRISWLISGGLNSEEFHLRKAYGPQDRATHKIFPSYSLSYSDTFFNGRLGIVLGAKESNHYTEQYRVDQTYNRTPTPADPRPQVLTALAFKDGPLLNKRFTGTVTADFKATDRLVLSLSATYSGFQGHFANRGYTFQAATNNTNATTGRQFALGDETTLRTNPASAATARAVTPGFGNGIKVTVSRTLVPRFEYRLHSLVLDGAMAYSRSNVGSKALSRGTAPSSATNAIQGIGFVATRPDPQSTAWQVTQTAGPDWSDLVNFTNPRMNGDGAEGFNEVYNGELNLRIALPTRQPAFVKVEGKIQERHYDYENRGALQNWSYVGPGGGTTGSFANYVSPNRWDMGMTGARFNSINGTPTMLWHNRDALGALIREHPEYFVNTATANNYFDANYGTVKDLTERVSSLYSMANARINRWQFQGGVRWERTQTTSKEWDPLPPSQVAAAGYPVNNTTGRATTIPGMDHQYRTQPRVKRTGEYDNYFPSITAKYRFTENLMADFGAGHTISRPNLNRIGGLWQINEINTTVSVGNPNLKPEQSDRFVAGLSYYFPNTVGNFSVMLSETVIENIANSTEMTSDEFGNTDPEFDQYTFITWTSGSQSAKFRSLELSYRHHLNFLPDLFRGTTVFGSYTRTYASQRRPGLTPHKISGGFDYVFKRVNLGMSAIWLDEAPWTTTLGRYRQANIKFDLNAGFRVRSNVTLFVQARNIFNDPHRIDERIGDNEPVLWRTEDYGANWVFGVKGHF